MMCNGNRQGQLYPERRDGESISSVYRKPAREGRRNGAAHVVYC